MNILSNFNSSVVSYWLSWKVKDTFKENVAKHCSCKTLKNLNCYINYVFFKLFFTFIYPIDHWNCFRNMCIKYLAYFKASLITSLIRGCNYVFIYYTYLWIADNLIIVYHYLWIIPKEMFSLTVFILFWCMSMESSRLFSKIIDFKYLLASVA